MRQSSILTETFRETEKATRKGFYYVGVDDTFHYPDTMAVMEPNGKLHTFHIEHMIMGDTVSWDAFEQNGLYHFREISDVEVNGTAVARKFFQKIAEGVCTKSLREYDHRADNLLYRNGKYLSLRDKGTINIIEDEDRNYRVGFEIDGIKFRGEDLEKLLGAFPGFSMRYQMQDASDPVLKEIETDDDHFPFYDIELICKTVDPFGIDEELRRICEDLFL